MPLRQSGSCQAEKESRQLCRVGLFCLLLCKLSASTHSPFASRRLSEEVTEPPSDSTIKLVMLKLL